MCERKFKFFRTLKMKKKNVVRVFSPDFDYIILQYLSNHHKSGFKTT